MSGTQNLSPLLQDPAWQVLSRQLSVEARIAIFYLDELWNDERFQRDWTCLKHEYLESQKEAIAELTELLSGNTTLTRSKLNRADALWETAFAQARSLVWRLEHVPFLVRRAIVGYLFDLVDRTLPPIIEEAEDEDSRLRQEYASGVENIYASRDPENFFLAEWELVRGFFSGELGELRLKVYLHDRVRRAVESFEAFPKPPFFVAKRLAPLPGETKRDYLKRIERDLKHEVKLLTEPSSRKQPEILSTFMKRLRYEFHNPRNAIPAILALFEDYYEKCAAERGLQVSNLNDATLARYARQVYLRVVKGETWGAISDKLFKDELDDLYNRYKTAKTKQEIKERREILRQRVISSTAEACRLLGIPLPKKRKV
jgi:ketosteroid isomerase-like protein